MSVAVLGMLMAAMGGLVDWWGGGGPALAVLAIGAILGIVGMARGQQPDLRAGTSTAAFILAVAGALVLIFLPFSRS
ncbi:hypothetical protein ACL02T_29940 [Pseudonocardia sp. RS010]|uniref:hypothetical protein n=1 Tax=Pseudonocardia sp. RS010 TaxID=3385979 RepID=UPI0039A2E509